MDAMRRPLELRNPRNSAQLNSITQFRREERCECDREIGVREREYLEENLVAEFKEQGKRKRGFVEKKVYNHR